ncbi:hypothetical protein BROUX41_004388 [Berkeleyomyces rouxiae]|uniref:uncharacterized protein n=1 Tax=Berkeleyomyces rouxiae TaxID=2035830 RepID=UPI003B7FA71F
MDRRTFEGPMDWEYHGTGPLDASSPFAKHVKGFTANNASTTNTPLASSQPQPSFGTPSRSVFASNPFAPANTPSTLPSTPSKPLAPLSSQNPFTPKLQPPSAPPFRNPAFTTPRRPFNESIYSEPESSPAMTEKASDIEMETPEADRTDDSFATITPTKIDKRSRYVKSARRPGRGEIPRGHREFSSMEVIRRRTRQVLDRDVRGSRYRLGHYTDASDYETEDDGRPMSSSSASSSIHQRRRDRPNNKGWMGGMLRAMEDHPNAPENFYKWIQVGFNVAIFSGVMVFCWQIIGAIKSDLDKANAAARANSINEVQECTTNYLENRCGQAGGPVPYLRDRCAEWDVCMQRDVDAVMSIRVVIREIAEIVNEFSGTMQFRSWLLVGGMLFVAIFAANISLFRNAYPRASSTPPMPAASAPSATAGSGFGAHHDPNQGYMYVPLQTPSSRRHMALMNDDMDHEEPRSARHRMHALMAPPQTPTSKRSPYKGDFRGANYRDRSMSMSPSKRSPSKMSTSFR